MLEVSFDAHRERLFRTLVYLDGERLTFYAACIRMLEEDDCGSSEIEIEVFRNMDGAFVATVEHNSDTRCGNRLDATVRTLLRHTRITVFSTTDFGATISRADSARERLAYSKPLET